MKKRILCIVIAGISLLSLTACSDTAEGIGDISNTSNISETAIVPTAEVDSKNARIHVVSLEGKPYSEIISKGYRFTGYTGTDGNYEFTLTHDELPEGVATYIPALYHMTIGDLLDKNFYIGYSTDYETECVFNITAGSFCINFDTEDCLDILKAHQNDEFFDVENATELHDKKILNAEIESMEYTIKFKDDVSALIKDNFDDSVLSNYVVDKFYYVPIETAFL